MAREDHAIESWCRIVSTIEGRRCQISERPDKRQPGRAGCDALIERDGSLQALEHTTLDAYEQRRLDDDRFRRVVLPVATVFEERFGDSWIEMEVPIHAIPLGEDWAALRSALIARCLEAIAAMPIAPYYDLRRTRFDWPEIPFPVWISRMPRAESNAKCIIFRRIPGDLHDQLVADVNRALVDKTEQLRPYKEAGRRTVLLLDFDDTSLLNRDSVASAFSAAAQAWTGANVIDEIFLIDTGRRPPWVYPVKLDERVYPDLREFETFFSEQFRLNYPDLSA